MLLTTACDRFALKVEKILESSQKSPKNEGNFLSINLINFFIFSQIDLIERRSRRDMSPQGRKRVAGMVSRDYQTVSGVGGTQAYPHQVRSFSCP